MVSCAFPKSTLRQSSEATVCSHLTLDGRPPLRLTSFLYVQMRGGEVPVNIGSERTLVADITNGRNGSEAFPEIHRPFTVGDA